MAREARKRSGLRGQRRIWTPEKALRFVEALVAASVLLVLLQALLGFSVFDGAVWERFLRIQIGFGPDGFNFHIEGALYEGFRGTIFYIAIVIPLGLLVGFLWAWARVSGYRFLSYPVTLFIELLRGVPPIVLIAFAFLFGAELFRPLVPNPFAAAGLVAAFALALHTAAYQAEIFRAGFQSIPGGQVEAARAVGMSGGQVMGLLVLPQTFRLSLPPLANEWASAIKDTALLGAIGVFELYASGQETAGLLILTFPFTSVFLVWTVIAAVFVLITLVFSRVLLAVERRFRVPGMEGMQA